MSRLVCGDDVDNVQSDIELRGRDGNIVQACRWFTVQGHAIKLVDSDVGCEQCDHIVIGFIN